MANKISKELSDEIYSRYLELKKTAKFKKGYIQKLLSEEFNIGLTTAFDHGRGREKVNGEFQGKEKSVKENIEPIKWQPKISSMPSLEYKKLDDIKKTYIITGWDLRVGINDSFLTCITTLKKELDADLLLVPMIQKDKHFIPHRLREIFTVVEESLKLNENIYLECVPINVLAQSPLSGYIGSFPGKSVIIPGLTKELTSEPSIHYCKQIMTTGSAGYLDSKYSQFDDYENNIEFQKRWNTISNSSNSKAMTVCQRFVKPSALILDIIDEKTFLTRYVTMETNGVIYDLNKKITLDKIENSNPIGLVLGDYHAYVVDEKNHKATKEMIKFFNPDEVFLNDFADMISANHHEIDNAVTYSKVPSIKEEAEVTSKILEEITSISKRVVYLNSNHDNFLLKLLAKPEMYWRMNNNLSSCYRLQAYTMDAAKHPIIELLKLDSIKNLYFSDEKEIYHANDVAVIHGHESFARMDFKGFAKVYNNIVTGHFHKPQVWRNAVCVGATAQAEQSYSIGVNATLGANCLVQPDNSLQLLPIIKGLWIK